MIIVYFLLSIYLFFWIIKTSRGSIPSTVPPISNSQNPEPSNQISSLFSPGLLLCGTPPTSKCPLDLTQNSHEP